MTRTILGMAVGCWVMGLLAPQALAAEPRPLDRTILPVQEPARALHKELDARNVAVPPRFEVKAPAGAPNVVIVLIRDFVLAADVEDLDVPQARIERFDDGTYAASVTFIPTFPAAQQPAEVIFLVDRSGSMEGTSIQEVRNALQLCLRSMIAGCRFNIVGFGTTFESLFPRSRRYDDASLADARVHVSTLQANLGGTDILPALQFALEQPRSELPRQIVVLTDGEVTNTDAVLALAREHVANARIFTFGIGAGASHHLDRAARRIFAIGPWAKAR